MLFLNNCKDFKCTYQRSIIIILKYLIQNLITSIISRPNKHVCKKKPRHFYHTTKSS